MKFCVSYISEGGDFMTENDFWMFLTLSHKNGRIPVISGYVDSNNLEIQKLKDTERLEVSDKEAKIRYTEYEKQMNRFLKSDPLELTYAKIVYKYGHVIYLLNALSEYCMAGLKK